MMYIYIVFKQDKDDTCYYFFPFLNCNIKQQLQVNIEFLLLKQDQSFISIL